MRAESRGKWAILTWLAIILTVCLLVPNVAPAKHRVAPDVSLSSALCQVVYPLDESPEEGYRYMFLGNGFFVNDQGYVVTAAHLLSYFRHGGQPYVLVGPPEGPRRMLEAPIMAADWDHDVAVLRATPNPFQGDKRIAYLPLSTVPPAPGDDVLEDSLIPPDEKNAHSSAAPHEDFSQGEVINYQFYRERGEAERQLLLFNQQVVPGQSGAPLVSAGTHAVVGVVVGRWLHPAVAPSGPEGGHVTVSPGAALRIHYAIGLLEQLHVPWDMASHPSEEMTAASQQTEGFAAPIPLSLVATPYPPQALFGGEVLLDAEVGRDGELSDVRVASGSSPFLDVALGAVRTWSFLPARMDGHVVESRIGIVFQFPQSFLPRMVQKDHKYAEPFSGAVDRGALPVFTVEPGYPPGSLAEGSVILDGLVDAQGRLTSASAIHGVDSLVAPTKAALRQWQFVPGLRAGANVRSEIIVVTTFRRPTE
jgi:Trypsin-like peptidase domain/Gram-negative bacterial TonB protein C-terminal